MFKAEKFGTQFEAGGRTNQERGGGYLVQKQFWRLTSNAKEERDRREAGQTLQ